MVIIRDIHLDGSELTNVSMCVSVGGGSAYFSVGDVIVGLYKMKSLRG